MAAFRADEAIPYPAGFSTASMMQRGETQLSSNGLIVHGLSDRLFVVVNLSAVDNGVVASNIRYSLPTRNAFSQAIEFSVTGFSRSVTETYFDALRVRQRGAQAWLRLSESGSLGRSKVLSWHGYMGYSFDSEQIWVPDETRDFVGSSETGYGYLDYGIALQWNMSPSWTLNVNYMRGSTAYASDRQPQKYTASLGLQFAPFDARWPAWLRNLRAEVSAVWFHVEPVSFSQFWFPTPSLYWQW